MTDNVLTEPIIIEMSIGLRLVLLASIVLCETETELKQIRPHPAGVQGQGGRRHLFVLLRQRGQLREHATTGAGDSVVMGTKLDVTASEIRC